MMGGSGFIQNMIISLRENSRLQNRGRRTKSSDFKTHKGITHEKISEDDLDKIKQKIISENKKVRKKLIILFVITLIAIIILVFLFNNNVRIKGINGY